MSTRITFYAVDTDYAQQLGQLPLLEVLTRYVNATFTVDKPHNLHIPIGSPFLNYHAIPRRGIILQPGQTEDLALREQILGQTLKAHLAQSHSFQLSFLLRGFSDCANMDWVRRLIWGYRQWWVGSFLEGMQRYLGPESAQYRRLVDLFQIVLRGRDCGTPLDAPALSLSDFTFPLMPEDDSDFPMGVWHRDDYMFFLDIVRGISPDFHFASPSGYRSRPKTIEDDEEFDEWVRKMLGQLRELARVPYQNMVGVTFIS